MTVKELIRALEAYPEHLTVILSRDAEGNGYAKLDPPFETKGKGLILYPEHSQVSIAARCEPPIVALVCASDTA